MSGVASCTNVTYDGPDNIEAKVNGKGPFRFQVDTGYGGMIEVTPAIAKTLALPVIGESISGDPSGKNQKTGHLFSAESVTPWGLSALGLARAPLPSRLNGLFCGQPLERSGGGRQRGGFGGQRPPV